MGKRSRDASFSPPAEDGSSPATTIAPSPDADDLPPSKLVPKPASATTEAMMKCSLSPHREPLHFDTLEAFDIHYAQTHTNRCSSCQANLPSPHLLTLHIDENHNPIRQVSQERGEKTLACFLPECSKKCATPQKRRLHLIDKHAFPKDYNFRIVDRGIDKATSMLKEGRRRRIPTSMDPTQSLGHRRRASSLQQKPSEVNGAVSLVSQGVTAGKAEIDELERSMSALRFVPASVTRRRSKKP